MARSSAYNDGEPAKRRPPWPAFHRGEVHMSFLSHWWVLPVVLFVVPLLAALLFNKLFRHRNGVNANWVMALFIGSCWLSALIIILKQVW